MKCTSVTCPKQNADGTYEAPEQCTKDRLPGFTVCHEHVTKEALLLQMVHLELQIRELNARISAPPWMSEICTALGWQGGTWTQVIAEVTRLVEVAAESRRQIKSLMGTMGADA